MLARFFPCPCGPALTLLLVLILSTCTDPIEVGADLLDDDSISLGQTTSLPLDITTVRGDSFLVYPLTNEASVPRPTFGRIEDPVFGTTDHSWYVTPFFERLNGTARVVPDFVNSSGRRRIDSIVLIVELDTAGGFYGPGRVFDIAVEEIADPVPELDPYYSNFEPLPVTNALSNDGPVTLSKTPMMVHDTVYTGGDTILRPHFRLRMSEELVDRFENELAAEDLVSDSTFWPFFAGVKLSLNSPSDALAYLNPASSNTTNYTGFNVYYTSNTGRDTVYRFFPQFWLPNYRFDYVGALAEDVLARDEGGNTVTLLQGQGGLLARIQFTNLDELAGTIINQARMTFTVQTPEGLDYEDFPAPDDLRLFYRSDEGRLLPILDELRLGLSNPDLVDLFLGGNRKNTENGEVYEMNLTVHLQGVLAGDFPPEVYLQVPAFAGRGNPGRVALSGTETADDPVTFSVTFTVQGQ